MITDPWFYAAAIIGTFLIGMSKSGFMPGIGALGVPLMALTISPVQAAAIQLPLLVATDIIGVWNYRRDYHWPNLRCCCRRRRSALRPAGRRRPGSATRMCASWSARSASSSH